MDELQLRVHLGVEEIEGGAGEFQREFDRANVGSEKSREGA